MLRIQTNTTRNSIRNRLLRRNRGHCFLDRGFRRRAGSRRRRRDLHRQRLDGCLHDRSDLRRRDHFNRCNGTAGPQRRTTLNSGTIAPTGQYGLLTQSNGGAGDDNNNGGNGGNAFTTNNGYDHRERQRRHRRGGLERWRQFGFRYLLSFTNAGSAGEASVTNNNTISTSGNGASAIFANSQGGAALDFGSAGNGGSPRSKIAGSLSTSGTSSAAITATSNGGGNVLHRRRHGRYR